MIAPEAMASFSQPFSSPFIPRKRDDARSPERLRAHYLVERRLADRVRNAGTWEERRAIFATMYDDLFREVPDHPRLAAHRADTEWREKSVSWNLAQLRPYLRPGCTFLEIGAGDCALASRVAREAKQVYAVDISDQTQGELPANVKLVISDGRSVDVPAGSIDLAFSDQLMEHLHPDDAIDQLRNIHRALKPGGVYVCVTPNRVYGPSDISAFFDDEPRGFHLKEYTLKEIRAIFVAAGFPRSHVYIGARGCFLRCPVMLVSLVEAVLTRLPAPWRRRLSDTKLARALLGLRVAAIKG
jgi:SAM-dependent methyltransferase